MREGWLKFNLEDLCTKIVDCEHKTAPLSVEGYPSIRTPNIGKGNLIIDNVNRVSEETYKLWTKREIPKYPDLIFAREAPLGNVGIIPKGLDVCLGQRTVLLRPDLNCVNPRFLCYRMLAKDVQDDMHSKGGGSTVPHLNVKEIKKLQISIPHLETQRKITNILSGYDDLIENNQKRIKILEEMAQQTYEEWFVRMRFPSYETAVFDENGLPEGWEKVKLGEACNLVMGQSPKSEDYNVDGNGLPFHQGVKDYGYRFPLNKSWSISGNKKAIPNSILFSVRAPVGRLNVASEEIILGRGLAAINDKNGLNSFLYYQLRTIFFEDNLIGGGAIYASVTKNDVERIELIYANELGGRFNDYASKIDKEILNLTNQNQRLREARDILLPRLMMGMIDVSGSLVQVESLEAKPTDAKVIPLEQPKKEASKEFKEAVLIACLTERFGSEKFPLGRKRYTKLSYLFHRYSDNKIQDYLRKAAGPYNPKTKYGGPEKIALNNKYIQNWKSDNGTTGFVAAEKIDDAKKYFSNYWQIADLDWLITEFKFKSNDELELLATVDNSLVELFKKNLDFTVANVLDIIKSEKEWEAKLERAIFSDANVEKAIGFLKGVLEYKK